MVTTHVKVVWRSATLESGGQCVQKSGIMWTPAWSVDNSGLKVLVSYCYTNLYLILKGLLSPKHVLCSFKQVAIYN